MCKNERAGRVFSIEGVQGITLEEWKRIKQMKRDGFLQVLVGKIGHSDLGGLCVGLSDLAMRRDFYTLTGETHLHVRRGDMVWATSSRSRGTEKVCIEDVLVDFYMDTELYPAFVDGGFVKVTIPKELWLAMADIDRGA